MLLGAGDRLHPCMLERTCVRLYHHSRGQEVAAAAHTVMCPALAVLTFLWPAALSADCCGALMELDHGALATTFMNWLGTHKRTSRISGPKLLGGADLPMMVESTTITACLLPDFVHALHINAVACMYGPYGPRGTLTKSVGVPAWAFQFKGLGTQGGQPFVHAGPGSCVWPVQPAISHHRMRHPCFTRWQIPAAAMLALCCGECFRCATHHHARTLQRPVSIRRGAASNVGTANLPVNHVSLLPCSCVRRCGSDPRVGP